MTVDSGCPVTVAQELLTALVALADRDPAKVRPLASTGNFLFFNSPERFIGGYIVNGPL